MGPITYRIAQQQDVEAAFNFAYQKNKDDSQSEIENQMMVWNSYFRKESLEHYFKTGWSFLAETEDKNLVGFFMAQPLLFLDKQTQSLWVELIQAENDEIYTELLDIAYRLSREKHFQKVLFSEDVQKIKLTKNFSFQPLERKISYLKTTK